MNGVRARHVVRPHTTSPTVLRAQREVYRQGRTPLVDDHGRVGALDMRPSDARTAGRHLGEVGARYGEAGLGDSVRGLAATRGWGFAAQSVEHAPERSRIPAMQALHGASTADREPEGQIVGAPVGPTVGSTLDRSSPAGGLPAAAEERLGASFGHDLSDIRIHDDEASHRAAAMLSARAFTVGRSIYFGRGEYQPTTAGGFRLLAHEVAHAEQQRGAARPAPPQLQVSTPASGPEHEADRAADAVAASREPAPIASRPVGAARVMRAISFTMSRSTTTARDPTAREDGPGTFQIAQGVPSRPHFAWDAEVTINGNAGDPFGNFVVGPHQVVRAFWFNIWWSHGANRSHRTSTVTTPIRDATAVGNTWYHDAFASVAFTAAGDRRGTRLDDTPGAFRQPYANPVAGRAGSSGTFNWGMAFVSYISAQDTTRGTGAAAFQTLQHVYWNLSVNGRFDGTRATPADRVTVTGGGRTNVGRLLGGADRNFPTMHGGSTFNVDANANLTTT